MADRTCTPPPARPEYAECGARVSLPQLPELSLPSDADLDASIAAWREKNDARVLDEMRALIANRPTVPARGRNR